MLVYAITIHQYGGKCNYHTSIWWYMQKPYTTILVNSITLHHNSVKCLYNTPVYANTNQILMQVQIKLILLCVNSIVAVIVAVQAVIVSECKGVATRC